MLQYQSSICRRVSEKEGSDHKFIMPSKVFKFKLEMELASDLMIEAQEWMTIDK